VGFLRLALWGFCGWLCFGYTTSLRLSVIIFFVLNLIFLPRKLPRISNAFFSLIWYLSKEILTNRSSHECFNVLLTITGKQSCNYVSAISLLFVYTQAIASINSWLLSIVTKNKLIYLMRFYLIRHSKYSAKLSKIHSYRQLFRRYYLQGTS